jgi:hypothetical protein
MVGVILTTLVDCFGVRRPVMADSIVRFVHNVHTGTAMAVAVWVIAAIIVLVEIIVAMHFVAKWW